jgi:hypothetical protein
LSALVAVVDMALSFVGRIQWIHCFFHTQQVSNLKSFSAAKKTILEEISSYELG